jgi:hypothetical protein
MGLHGLLYGELLLDTIGEFQASTGLVPGKEASLSLPRYLIEGWMSCGLDATWKKKHLRLSALLH